MTDCPEAWDAGMVDSVLERGSQGGRGLDRKTAAGWQWSGQDTNLNYAKSEAGSRGVIR